MPRHLHIDFETFSKADLRDVGAYRYAYDPSTEILCAAMALGDHEPETWFRGQGEHSYAALEPHWQELEDPSVLIYAHNAMFEAAICQALLWKTWGIRCPDLSRFRCTMSLARRAALPGKLETLAEVLGLKNLKDKRGKQLINKFSVMQKGARVSKKNPHGGQPFRLRPEDDPAAFAEFVEYCRQDVRVEQEVARKLAFFDEPINNASYSLDARINARGVTVNLSALRHAQKLIDEETEIISEQFRRLTGFEVTQNAVFIKWLHGQGCHLDDLQAETVDTFLDKFGNTHHYELAVHALRMKQSIAYASTKKVATMLECAGPHDNRIRGMLNHHGATTGRWTASLVQFQNMKRSTIKDSDGAYRMICEGVNREMLEICYGPVLEVISSCIRHFVHDFKHPVCAQGFKLPIEENPLLDADYSSIESRIVCWLAGQEDALQEYREGLDRYVQMASVIYQIPAEDVNKFPQRFLGKTAILACSYGMGRPKFRGTCEKLGYKDMPPGLEDTAVDVWRAKHKKVVQYWYDLERAAKRAILNPEQAIKLRNVAFLHHTIEGMPFLLLRLPSGRQLAYPRPRIANDRIVFFGKLKTTQWGDCEMWGGTICENISQAVAADIMVNGAQHAENAGYEIATLIHDQALAYHKEGQTPDEFVRLLTRLPAWAAGLPVEAEGSLVPFYRKD